MDHSPARETATADPRTPRLQRSLASLLTVLAVVATSLVVGGLTAAPASATSVEDVFTQKLNQARTSRGIPRLTTRDSLVRVAREQAREMASRNRLYHNPDLATDVSNYRWVGENVGYGPDALTVHVAFMRSPGHKANILERDYKEVGVGAVVVGGRVWVAEVFRQPLRTSFRSLASFQHTLRLGDRGAAVERVQARLNVRRTGYYNWRTKAAVSAFQKRQGWLGRGNVGPKTWARLF